MESRLLRRATQTSGVGLLLGLAFLAIMPLMVTGSEALAPADEPIMAGLYAGTVTITEPVPLGVMDMALTLAKAGGELSAEVEPARTMVFDGSPLLEGEITGSVDGITPTFSLRSESFDSLVSGRQVERTFTLSGEVLEGGEAIQGTYTEVITGIIPDELRTRGEFLFVRPPLPEESEDTPLPTDTPNPEATSTPEETPETTPDATTTPSPTTTTTPQPSDEHSVYLPAISGENGQLHMPPEQWTTHEYGVFLPMVSDEGQ